MRRAFYHLLRNQAGGFAVYLPRKDQLMSLLKWALIFLVVSIIAAVFGFTGISAASADIARILFFVFVVIFIVLLVLGLFAARRV
jgi:uncharacterized membrane protein YtjA (UPF0391 family)